MWLKTTSAQVIETSVIVRNDSSFENYTNPDDHTRWTTLLELVKTFYNVYLKIFNVIFLELQKQLHLSEAKSENLASDKNKLVSEYHTLIWFF